MAKSILLAAVLLTSLTSISHAGEAVNASTESPSVALAEVDQTIAEWILAHCTNCAGWL